MVYVRPDRPYFQLDGSKIYLKHQNAWSSTEILSQRRLVGIYEAVQLDIIIRISWMPVNHVVRWLEEGILYLVRYNRTDLKLWRRLKSKIAWQL